MFFFFIFLLIIVLLIGLIFSGIELHMQKVVTSPSFRDNKINRDSIIKIKFYFYGIIKYFEIDLKKAKLNKEELKRRINKIEKKINYKKSINILFILNHLNIKIRKLNLIINIDLEDAAVLAILVGIFSGIISNVLPRISNKNSIINWKINPIYQCENFLNISLNGILKTNLLHIIYTLYILNKQGGDKVEK